MPIIEDEEKINWSAQLNISEIGTVAQLFFLSYADDLFAHNRVGYSVFVVKACTGNSANDSDHRIVKRI
jgi:hypothetical protein